MLTSRDVNVFGVAEKFMICAVDLASPGRCSVVQMFVGFGGVAI